MPTQKLPASWHRAAWARLPQEASGAYTLLDLACSPCTPSPQGPPSTGQLPPPPLLAGARLAGAEAHLGTGETREEAREEQ